jgi:hypothetical protein
MELLDLECTIKILQNVFVDILAVVRLEGYIPFFRINLPQSR